MGVSGLLPALRASTQQVHIRDYRGKRVAIDSYVWLHRAVMTCAADLCMNVPTTKYIKYFMTRVQELLGAGIVPVLVFDGGKLPAKLAEEENRERKRAHSLAIASNLMREGNRTAAADHFAKAVDITPQLAHAVQAAVAHLGVEIIVAPYEADAQLAFLSRNGHVDAVISEDSDLLVYGCPEVLFKFDSASGMCDRILERDVAGCLGFPSHANADFLKHVALLNGCDYCPGVNNVGIKKAVDLLRELGGDSVVAVNTLRAQGYWIDDKDVQLMKLGILTYKHQVIYNPATQRLQHLAPLPAGAALADTSFLGHMYDDIAAVAVATGIVDPMTKLPFHALDEDCTCARHFALPITSNSDAPLSGGAFKRPRMSLPSSAAAPPSQAIPSVLSFFKASPSTRPIPPSTSSHAAELELQAVIHSTADATPEPPIVQARSKYFAAEAPGGIGGALPFSARGGACGSLFKNANRGGVDAAISERPVIKTISPRDGEIMSCVCLYEQACMLDLRANVIAVSCLCSSLPFPFAAIERLKQYRYHKDENSSLMGRASPGIAAAAAAAAAALQLAHGTPQPTTSPLLALPLHPLPPPCKTETRPFCSPPHRPSPRTSACKHLHTARLLSLLGSPSNTSRALAPVGSKKQLLQPAMPANDSSSSFGEHLVYMYIVKMFIHNSPRCYCCCFCCQCLNTCRAPSFIACACANLQVASHVTPQTLRRCRTYWQRGSCSRSRSCLCAPGKDPMLTTAGGPQSCTAAPWPAVPPAAAAHRRWRQCKQTGSAAAAAAWDSGQICWRPGHQTPAIH